MRKSVSSNWLSSVGKDWMQVVWTVPSGLRSRPPRPRRRQGLQLPVQDVEGRTGYLRIGIQEKQAFSRGPAKADVVRGGKTEVLGRLNKGCLREFAWTMSPQPS